MDGVTTFGGLGNAQTVGETNPTQKIIPTDQKDWKNTKEELVYLKVHSLQHGFCDTNCL